MTELGTLEALLEPKYKLNDEVYIISSNTNSLKTPLELWQGIIRTELTKSSNIVKYRIVELIKAYENAIIKRVIGIKRNITFMVPGDKFSNKILNNEYLYLLDGDLDRNYDTWFNENQIEYIKDSYKEIIEHYKTMNDGLQEYLKDIIEIKKNKKEDEYELNIELE